MTDGFGLPLGVQISAANRPDAESLLPLIDDWIIRRGRIPEEVLADKAYDSEAIRQELRDRSIEPEIPKRGTKEGGLGKRRWPVERSLSWLHQKRRLKIRYEKRDDIHQAFCQLTVAMNIFSQIGHAIRFC